MLPCNLLHNMWVEVEHSGICTFLATPSLLLARVCCRRLVPDPELHPLISAASPHRLLHLPDKHPPCKPEWMSSAGPVKPDRVPSLDRQIQEQGHGRKEKVENLPLTSMTPYALALNCSSPPDDHSSALLVTPRSQIHCANDCAFKTPAFAAVWRPSKIAPGP
jgi:hypothetical protein